MIQVAALTQPYREDFVCWAGDPAADPYDHDHHDHQGDCTWGWICSHCPQRVDEQPCPDHAPKQAPGLRLVECHATPRHWLFAHDREDYGHGCPWCWYEQAATDLTPLKEAAEKRAHRWCWLRNRLKRLAIRLGVARATCYSWSHARCHVDIKWRWT